MSKMKLFVVSDIHGHYDEMKKALDDAGFDPEDPTHLFVSCGDLFDRGWQNNKVMEYVAKLKRKVLIRGNHEDMLEAVFERGWLTYSNIRNGTGITVRELLDMGAVDREGRIDTQGSARRISRILRFIGETRDYFETENYIFTHGWLPVFDENGVFHPEADWRRAPIGEWRAARFTEWTEAYSIGATVEKTLVCGHRAAMYGSRFDPTRPLESAKPFYGKGMIAIDALTAASGRVNVLCLEEEVIEPVEHTMSLMPAMFGKMKRGQKTTEVRLFDEKRKAIRVGDRILFRKNEDESEVLMTEVLGLYHHCSFANFMAYYPPKEVGSSEGKEKQFLKLLASIYGERDLENGMLGIRVRRIK